MKPWQWAGVAIASLLIFKRQTIAGLFVKPTTALQDANVQAFLATIRHFESGGDYAILYGGGHFYDYSTHPNIHVPFYNPVRSGEQGVPNDYSTAAGAYQINHPTWLLWSAVPGAPSDFSPASQDYLAVVGLQLKGALPDIIAGNFASAVDKVSATWASMPGSTAHQNPATLAAVMNVYTSHGGVIA